MAIDYSGFAIPKGNRFADKLERRAKRKAVEYQEDRAKQKARTRDGHKCCWPHETAEDKALCRAAGLEAAHYKAKGMGGDHGLRSLRKNLITFCQPTHTGPKWSLHAGTRRVVPLEPEKLMDGPRAFEEKRRGKWVEVGREVSVGVLARSTTTGA